MQNIIWCRELCFGTICCDSSAVRDIKSSLYCQDSVSLRDQVQSNYVIFIALIRSLDTAGTFGECRKKVEWLSQAMTI